MSENWYFGGTIEHIYRRFGLSTDTMRKLFPKRYRKTAVICPVTGKETTNITGIDNDAWELIADGFKYRDQKAIDDLGKKWYATGYGDKPYWRDMADNRVRSGLDYGVLESLLKALGVVTAKGMRAHEYSKPKNAWDNETWLLEKPERPDWSNIEYLWMNEVQAEAVRSLYRAIQKEFDRCAQTNASSGQGFIRAMAEGRVSIDDYNNLALRLEKKEEK